MTPSGLRNNSQHLKAGRSHGKEVARQAAVSSESRRVIYSLWGGERAGDPEKANGAGRAGAPGAQGVVGECQHCGMREGKEGTHGSSRWQEDGEVPIRRCAGLTSPTFGGFEGLPLILLRSLGAPLPRSWVETRLQGGSDAPVVPRHPPGAWSQYPGMELLLEH